MSHETETETEKNKKQPNYPLRQKLGVVACVLVGAFGIYGSAKLVHAVEGRHIPPTPEKVAQRYDGYIDKNATSVTIEVGGKFRAGPFVQADSAGTTNLEDVTEEQLEIPVDGDVVISNSVDGSFVTFAKEKAKKLYPDLDIEGDYVSVSTQRATVHDKTPTDLANQ